MPAPVQGIKIKPSRFSADLSWTIPPSEISSYITHFLIYLDGKLHKNISRENGHQFTIHNLEPFTNYTVGIETQDGNFNKSEMISEEFETEESGKVPLEDPTKKRFCDVGILVKYNDNKITTLATRMATLIIQYRHSTQMWRLV